MPLIRLRDVSLSFGGEPLLERLNFQVDERERVCLVGRNGVGKSTLLKLISQALVPEEGSIERQQNLSISMLMQDVPTVLQASGASKSVYQVVADGLGDLGERVNHYHRLSQRVAQEPTPQLLGELEEVQHKLESNGGWRLSQQVGKTLSRMELDAEAAFAELSGGLQRRVLLANALVNEPDLLLLDEPTNHLDMETIAWLESFLMGFSGAIVFITHDRMFLQALATRIVEIDRGRLQSYPGDYRHYLARKEAALTAEAATEAEFDKKLAKEELWIRQGIKARRTRNEGRVRALEKMREGQRMRRARAGRANIAFSEAEQSGKLVIQAERIGYAYVGRFYVKAFSTTLMRGDKVGIIGPNGCGKTTLLQLLLGLIEPHEGNVRHGTRLEIAYFDQHRRQFEEEKSVRDNVAEGRETVSINGQSRHIMSYLQDFLFTADRARSPVKILSGGERNRLLLAKLFTRPFNVLVMDEPTNDLDMETLELLEELLVDYQGTLLLVSHDRAFIDNVVTSTLAFEGEGNINEYIGGYLDWLRQRKLQPAKTPPPKPQPERQRTSARKISYKQLRELESLPHHIEILEAEQQRLLTAMNGSNFYQQAGDAIATAKVRLQALELELATAYGRWEELEAIKS